MDRSQVTKAVKALLRHVEVERKKKTVSDLLEEDELISVIFTIKQIPPKHSAKPRPIALPHSPYGEEVEICVLTKGPQKFYRQKFKESGAANVSKVISLPKLRKNYKTYESKRNLVHSFDLFLADDRITPMLPKLLGKAFFKRKKQPLAIKVHDTDLKKVIEKAKFTTCFYIGYGSTVAVKVGNSGMEQSHIVDNIMQGMEKIVAKFIENGWDGLLSVHIRTPSSIALPIYHTLPDIGDIKDADDADAATKKQSTVLSPTGKKRKRNSIESSGSNAANDDDEKFTIAPKRVKKTTPSPKVTPKRSPKLASPKGTPKRTPKAQTSPKLASPKGTPKRTPKVQTSPKLASPKGTPKRTPNASTSKASPKVTPKRTPRQSPSVAKGARRLTTVSPVMSDTIKSYLDDDDNAGATTPITNKKVRKTKRRKQSV